MTGLDDNGKIKIKMNTEELFYIFRTFFLMN